MNTHNANDDPRPKKASRELQQIQKGEIKHITQYVKDAHKVAAIIIVIIIIIIENEHMFERISEQYSKPRAAL